jgi:hypothetical protein
MSAQGIRLPLPALAAIGVMAACSPVARDRGGEVCKPTGWVDRVEGTVAVLVPDTGEEEEYYDVLCFPEPPREGTRVVMGRIDWKETERTRRHIEQILGRILQEPVGGPAP